MSGTQGQNLIILLAKINGTIILVRKAVDKTLDTAVFGCFGGAAVSEILVLITFGGKAIAANSIAAMPHLMPTIAMTSCKADIVDRTLVVISSAHYCLGGISCLR